MSERPKGTPPPELSQRGRPTQPRFQLRERWEPSPREPERRPTATAKPLKRVIYAADPEFARVKREYPSFASANFVQEWTDKKGQLHTSGDRTMVHGWDGEVRVGEIYKHPPTFEESYGSWYLGRVVPNLPRRQDLTAGRRIGDDLASAGSMERGKVTSAAFGRFGACLPPRMQAG